MTSMGTLVGGAGLHNGWLKSLALATVGVGVLVGGVSLPYGQLEGLASTVGVPVGGAGPSPTAEVALEGPLDLAVTANCLWWGSGHFGGY